MPFQVNNNDNGLASLAGLAQGVASFVAAQHKAKADAAQQAIENEQNAKRLAIEQANSDAGIKAANADLVTRGFNPGTGARNTFTPSKSMSEILPNNKGQGTPTTDDYVKHYLTLSAAAQGAGRPDLAATYKGLADSYGLDMERTANAGFTSGAKTNYENALTTNVKGLFNHQLQMVDAKTRGQMQAVYARASSQAGRQNIGIEARESIAAITAMNTRAGMNYAQAYQTARDQYNQEQQNYRASFDASGNPPQGAVQPTFVMPPPQPIIIMGPGGKPMAVQPPTPPAAPAPRQAAPATPAAAPAQAGGGFEWWNPTTWGGHGSAPAPGGGGHRLRATSHGHPIHSDDGGKTWQPGA